MDTTHEPRVDGQDRQKAISLKDFALLQKITEESVWEMLEEGKLSARFVNDSILIFRENEKLEDMGPSFEPEIEPPEYLLNPIAEETDDQELMDSSFLDTSSASHQAETSSDVLVFLQDTLARSTELSQQLLAAKDELLLLKDDKILHLERQLLAKDEEMRRIRRELENMQTLHKIVNQPSLLRDLLPREP